MKRLTHWTLTVLLVAMSMGTTGCGLHRLKDENRRLKESNDRLISENNRLEEQLSSMHRRVDELQAAPAPASVAVADVGQAPAMGLSLPDPDLLGIDPDVSVRKTADGGISFRVGEQVFFGLGQTSLTTRGQATLDRVARIIRDEYPNQVICVEGHTDDIPINRLKARYPTNWELSTARACTVVRYLVERGMDRQKIFAAGFGEYRPVTALKTEAARRQNRRVEITVMNTSTF